MIRIATIIFAVAAVLSSVGAANADKARTTKISQGSILEWPANLPVYDHVVIVIEENKGYEQIIGNPAASYINDILRKEGANLTRTYAEEHFSEGNYFWLFSGDNQHVGYTDRIPSAASNSAYPFTASNFGQQLIANGLTFKGYSESLPAIGFSGDFHGLYARKHVPWVSFANIPNGEKVVTSSNLRFKDFPVDPDRFHALPTVAFIVPNQGNDMHNGTSDMSIPKGDAWLRRNIDPYYQWAKEHNSLLILTFDENEDKHGYIGLTDPSADPQKCNASDHAYCMELQNHIVTIFAGAHIKPGDYPERRGITHVNILRMLEAMYGLPRSGRQQTKAIAAGIKDDFVITDIFEDVH